jgi:hypothetical protein
MGGTADDQFQTKSKREGRYAVIAAWNLIDNSSFGINKELVGRSRA